MGKLRASETEDAYPFLAKIQSLYIERGRIALNFQAQQYHNIDRGGYGVIVVECPYCYLGHMHVIAPEPLSNGVIGFKHDKEFKAPCDLGKRYKTWADVGNMEVRDR